MTDRGWAIAASGTVATRAPPRAGSRLGHSASVNYRKKSRRKTRENYVKRRKHATSLKQGTGGINPCYRPSREASKADLAEYHREEMALRRSHQLKRAPGFTAIDRKEKL